MPSLLGIHTLWTALHIEIGIFKVMNEIGFFNNRKEGKRDVCQISRKDRLPKKKSMVFMACGGRILRG